MILALSSQEPYHSPNLLSHTESTQYNVSRLVHQPERSNQSQALDDRPWICREEQLAVALYGPAVVTGTRDSGNGWG
jgi:hypothetical protein